MENCPFMFLQIEHKSQEFLDILYAEKPFDIDWFYRRINPSGVILYLE